MNQIKKGVLFIGLFLVGLISVMAQTNRNVSNFHELSVSGPFDVEVTQGNTESLQIEANSKFLDHIVTEVINNELRIYMKKGTWQNWGSHSRNPKIYLNFKILTHISASASAEIDGDKTIKAENIKLEASSSGDIHLDDLQASEVECNVSSGSDIDIVGKANFLSASASSGADLDADKFKVKKCKAAASSGADMSLNVSQDLDAVASSGADIDYRGNPQKIRVNSTSGADITPKN